MKLTGNWLLVQRIVTTSLFKLLRLVYTPVQHAYWQLNGTAQKVRDSQLPDNYERSAQVLDVVYCHKFCVGQATTITDFLCTHNRFEDPQYIIDNDNITLLTISDNNAVFCEAQEKGMHLWRIKYGPFIHYAQMAHYKRLIVVPLSTFHRLAQEIGDPKGELIFLFNTTRCGSTLLNQIMECTGRCVSVSEPTAPTLVATRCQKYGESEELAQLARDVIRWECRPYQTMNPQPLGYFLKLTGPCIAALPMFRRLFPSSRLLFMYRDVATVAKSVYRLTMSMPSARLIYIVGRFSGRVNKVIVDSTGFDGSDFCVRADNDLTPGVLLSALITTSYLEMRRRGEEIKAVRYEDLVARPLDMCRVILEHCHFPVSLAEHAVRGFEADSQRNSPIAKSIIGSIKEPEITPEIKARLDEILKKYGLPLIGEPCILEGTLNCSDCSIAKH